MTTPSDRLPCASDCVIRTNNAKIRLKNEAIWIAQVHVADQILKAAERGHSCVKFNMDVSPHFIKVVAFSLEDELRARGFEAATDYVGSTLTVDG